MTTLPFQWLCQSVFNGPLKAVDSMENSIHADSANFSPFSKALCLTIECYKTIAACISGLLLSGRPDAVRWLVIPVVVLSLQCVDLAWPHSHIGKKVAEIHPSIAHRYSPVHIPVSKCAIYVRTTRNHRSPYVVCSTRTIVCGHPVLCNSLHELRSTFATARTHLRIRELHGRCLELFSAIARAVPVNRYPSAIPSLWICLGNDSDFSNFSSREIFRLCVQYIAVQAPAGLYDSCSQLITTDGLFIAAFADAIPKSNPARTSLTAYLNNGETTELHSCYVFNRHVNCNSIFDCVINARSGVLYVAQSHPSTQG